MSETTSLHLNHGLKDSEMIAVFKVNLQPSTNLPDDRTRIWSR
jgi:hypothetical protein